VGEDRGDWRREEKVIGGRSGEEVFFYRTNRILKRIAG
jgi:hypothetical protein